MAVTAHELRVRLRRGLQLTRGERLRTLRRIDGLTQEEMAGIYGVSLDCYRGWEADVGDVPIVTGELRVGDLPLGELCYIHRRRRGITLQEVAHALGRSVSWVHRAESGQSGIDELVGYLERRGVS